MVDLFWTVATSYVVLGLVGLILLAALVVGYFPLLKWFPVIGSYVPVARLVSTLAMGLLCLLLGFRGSARTGRGRVTQAQDCRATNRPHSRERCCARLMKPKPN